MKKNHLFLKIFIFIIFSIGELFAQGVDFAQQTLDKISELSFGKIKIFPLSGGLTNHVFLVDSQNYGKLVLRLQAGTDSSVIDKKRTALNTEIIGEIGIGPKVFFKNLEGSLLLIHYFPGEPLKPDIITSELMSELVNKINTFHEGDIFHNDFNPYENINQFRSTAVANGIDLPEKIKEADLVLKEISEVLIPLASKYHSPCHNDLHLGNILYSPKREIGDQLSIIDWDYSGNGDSFYDFAVLSNTLSFNEDDSRLLLKIKFLKNNNDSIENLDAHLAHLQLLRMVSHLWNSYWSFSQIGISKMTFDHQEVANQELDLFFSMRDSKNYPHWLTRIKNESF